MATNFACADSDFQQSRAKKKRLSANRDNTDMYCPWCKEANRRVKLLCAAIMSTTDDLNISKKELTTKNTEKSTMWAVRLFNYALLLVLMESPIHVAVAKVVCGLWAIGLIPSHSPHTQLIYHL